MGLISALFSKTRTSRQTRRTRPARPQCPPGSTVQTLLFPRDSYGPREARAWALSHGFKAPKADVTDRYVRLRQLPPSSLRRMRTINFGRGIKAVIGWRKC